MIKVGNLFVFYQIQGLYDGERESYIPLSKLDLFLNRNHRYRVRPFMNKKFFKINFYLYISCFDYLPLFISVC